MRSTLEPTVALLAAVVAAGCDVRNTAVADLDGVPAAFLDAACARAVACRGAPDLDACRASEQPPTVIVRLVASVKAGRAVYHADRMADCLARTRASDCTLSQASTTSAICDEAFEGTVAAGGPCSANGECRSRSCFNEGSGNPCACGLSQPKNVPPGGTCKSSGDCAGAATCGPGGICASLPGEGEACPTGTACLPPLLCAAGTCRRAPGPGEACDPAAGIPCDRVDDGCDPTTHTCQPYADVGEPCGAAAGGAPGPGCVAYASCDGAVCQQRPALGEPCMGAFCIGELLCDPVTSVCVVLPSLPAGCGS
jgi:hypothetical protein